MIVSPPRPMTRPSRPAHGIASSASGLTARAKGGEGGGRSQRPRRRGERRGERRRERERGRRRGASASGGASASASSGASASASAGGGEATASGGASASATASGGLRAGTRGRGRGCANARARARGRGCANAAARRRGRGRRAAPASPRGRGANAPSDPARASLRDRRASVGRNRRPPAPECTRVCATAPRRLRSGVGEIWPFERDCLCSVIIFCECSNAKLNVQCRFCVVAGSITAPFSLRSTRIVLQHTFLPPSRP